MDVIAGIGCFLAILLGFTVLSNLTDPISTGLSFAIFIEILRRKIYNAY